MARIILKKTARGFTLIIVLFIGINWNATSRTLYRQKARITLSANNIPLEEVFKKIKQQTGITIQNSFQETQLNEQKRVSINFRRTDINEVMEFLLNDKKDLSFILRNSIILIFKLTNNLQNPSNVHNYIDTISNNLSLSGKIIDSDGNPIPGATVKSKNNKIGTISSADGIFRLADIDKGSTITVSCIGFESKDIIVTGKDMLIQLTPHTNILDEKVVIAYGSTTKRLNTGNVGSLKATEIKNQLVNNPLTALQGRVPGIFIEQTTGLPGSGITVRIQGVNSIFKGNDPFYVIDGVPYISQLLPINNTITGTSGVPGISGNPLSYINSADIESIEVLKDADATAIYGSRAANGAVLITTRKGKAGPIKVDLMFQSGWARTSRKMSLLNTKEYLDMRHEAIKNSGLAIKPSDYDLNGTWDTTRNVDWQKELIGNTAHYTDAQFNVSGGSIYTQFLFGIGYHKESTVYPGTFSDTKGSVHLSLNSNSANQKFKIQVVGSFIFDDNKLPTRDITAKALTLAPVAPDPYNMDGTLNWMPNAAGASSYSQNPLASLAEKSNNKTLNLIGNTLLSYELIPGLTIKSSLGYNNLTAKEITKYPISIYTPEFSQYFTNRTAFLTNNINSWIIEPQMEYVKKTHKGNINILIGSTLTQLNSDQENISADGFANELVMENLASATSILGTNINSVYKYNALYGRATYNLLDKYIINFSARRDGSSRFGIENQFHSFGAIGVAWIFSQEPFIESNVPILSFGKLRGSFGTTGNDQIGDYQFMDTYQPFTVTGNAYQGVVGLLPTSLTNPYLQWEETKKLQVGLELGFMKDKLIMIANYIQNRSSNQLTIANLPTITGFTGITRNFPAVVQNTGWEFTVSSTNIKTKHFNWSTNFNLTIPKNQLLSYYGQDKNNSVSIGRPLSYRSLYNYAGVNDTTGIYQFIDSKGNLTISPSDPTDKTILVDYDPKFYGGLQNSFSYKEFSIDIFFQFTKKSGTDRVTYGLNNNYPGFFNAGLGNQTSTVVNRWRESGDQAQIQQYRAGSDRNLSYISNSNATFVDASYIRLKNISLNWQLPNKWKKNLHLQNARLFLNAQNILTITNYKGLDPETGLSLPPLRTITIGAQITL